MPDEWKEEAGGSEAEGFEDAALRLTLALKVEGGAVSL